MKNLNERLEYAAELIEIAAQNDDGVMALVRAALLVIEFGGITPAQMIEYLEDYDD